MNPYALFWENLKKYVFLAPVPPRAGWLFLRKIMGRKEVIEKIIECGKVLSEQNVKFRWIRFGEESLRHDPWNLPDEQIQRLKDKQPEWHKDNPGCVMITLD